MADAAATPLSSGSTSPDSGSSGASVASTPSSTSSEEPQPTPRARKRTRNPAEWQRSKRKLLRNSGQAYTTKENKTVS